MVYKGSTDQLHAITILELAISASTQDGTGLSPVYIIYWTPIKMPLNMLDRFQGGTADA